jgi:phage/plasmid-associated DNA primase
MRKSKQRNVEQCRRFTGHAEASTLAGGDGATYSNAPASCSHSSETFTASQSERHPTDLADLRGARLVTSVETEEGSRWAEAKIKALTGGDKIAARRRTRRSNY